MRLRLTPPSSALPSPARPGGYPAGPRALPGSTSVRASGRGTSPRPSVCGHLRSTPPVCAARRREGVFQKFLLCDSLPALGFRTSRQYVLVPSLPQLPDPERVRLSPGVRPGGRDSSTHRVAKKCHPVTHPSRPAKAKRNLVLPEETHRGTSGPPLREERCSGWRAGQSEARTAAQRGAAAECKHRPARGGPSVSPHATHLAQGLRGPPPATLGNRAQGHPSCTLLQPADQGTGPPCFPASRPTNQLTLPAVGLSAPPPSCPFSAAFHAVVPAQETFAPCRAIPSSLPNLQFWGP